MWISKRSPRKSEAFRSRFSEAGADAAPLRHARRLKEYLVGAVVQGVLQVGFLVTLVFFARSSIHLFQHHGAHLSPWYLRLCLAAILVCFLLVLRRVIGRILEIREVRAELAEANGQLRELRDKMRGGPRS